MAKAKKAKAKTAKRPAKAAVRKAAKKKTTKPTKTAKKSTAKAKQTAKAKPKKATTRAKKPAKKVAKARKPTKSVVVSKPKKARAKPAIPRSMAKPPPPMLDALTLEAIVLASPERVYTAWLDSAEHSAFTGGEAVIDAVVGGKHSAWSGYIEGRFLELEPGHRIVMTWRTTEFEETDADSHCVMRFAADGGGTRIEIEHTELPPGSAQKYGTGWREFYFVPMRRYFEVGDTSADSN